MLDKQASPGADVVRVTFTVPPEAGAGSACVAGDFNGWSTSATPMDPQPDGGFAVSLDLPAGGSHRFRYLLDGDRWENDWAADAYVPNDFGGNDSLVDLSEVSSDVVDVRDASSDERSGVAEAEAPKRARTKKSKEAADR